MVTLGTNRPAYFNDLADELRLFLDHENEVAEVPFGQPADAVVTLGEENGLWHAKAEIRLGGQTGKYQWVCPKGEGSPLVIKREEKRAMKIAAFRAMKEIFGVTPPWGSLTGIRPTRLLRELMAAEGEEKALHRMREHFDVSAEKLALAEEIVAVQRPVLLSQTPMDADVYFGVPFCASRCLYCSFASQVRTAKTDMASYLNALCKDISLGAEILRQGGRKVRSMYFGGGTPTVLTAEELDRLLDHIMNAYGGYGAEFTVEAGRPDTITKEKLAVLKKYGAGRVSVNPQSMNEKTLTLIGRSHTPQEIRAAFYMARDAGFATINMDVIAGLPGEIPEDMAHTLEEIVKMAPENLTVHTLALKRSSRLAMDPAAYPLPDAEAAAEMVAQGERAARSLGMKPYYMYRQKYMRGNLENVGYAKPGHVCVYNIDMMEDTTAIMAHGAGAMTKCVYDAERRVERVPAPKEIRVYCEKVEKLAEEKRRLFLEG